MINQEPVTTVYITQIAKAKIERLIAHAPGEVGWYGVVDNYEGNLLIEDILVPYQIGTSGGQEETGDAIHKLLDEAGDNSEKIKCKGHSHPGFGVKPSATDLNALQGWENLGVDWFLTHIQNKKGDYTMRLDVWNPFRASCECDMVALASQRIDQWAKHMVETRVKKLVSSWRPLDRSHQQPAKTSGWPVTTGQTKREQGKKMEEVIDLAETKSSSNGFQRGDEVEPVINEGDSDLVIASEEDLKELMESNRGLSEGWWY